MRNLGRRIFNGLSAPVRRGAHVLGAWHADNRVARRKRRLREAKVAIGAEPEGLSDVNHLLHHLRSEALRALPDHPGHVVSVGCSGAWYFDWVTQMLGPIGLHTGVEFYTPPPAQLPPNVRWVANTAGHMPEIGDGVADILFSGQNIEHLWQADVLGFLLESHRILREGGLLVIDSPNRRVAARLGWSQPEHTVELNPEEMEVLLTLAGFTVERVIGLWLCEDPLSGALLPFDELTAEGPWPLQRRVAAAYHNPHSSFIWWIEARKQKVAPQPIRMEERINEIFRLGWPERLNRLKTVIGVEIAHNNRTWIDSGGHQGVLLFGPYAPLCAGHHMVRLRLLLRHSSLAPAARIGYAEVIAGDGAALATHEISLAETLAGEFEVAMQVVLSDTTFGVQFRVFSFEGVHLVVKKSVTLSSQLLGVTSPA